MSSGIIFWLLLTILCLIIQAFFAMEEMAAVSFNKARLHYYVNKGNKRAMWLNFLLQKPARLFVTTLMMINIALQVGSECSRQFYEALGLPPNIAPLTQIFLVVIFAELAPMFAARRAAEHAVMLGIPVVYFTSRLLTPLIVIINYFSQIINYLIRGKKRDTSEFSLNREELEKIFELHDSNADGNTNENELFNNIVSNIFLFRNKTAAEVMEPLNTITMAPSNCTVRHMRNILKHAYYDYLPVYHRSKLNIIGIAFPRDLLNIPDSARIRDYAHPPWFLTQKANIMDILQQFQRNRHTVAVILDHAGNAIGMLALKDILEEVFGEHDPQKTSCIDLRHQYIVEGKFPGDMSILDFDHQFNTNLSVHKAKTLAHLFNKVLGHPPQKGESIKLDNLEFTVEETSILGIKTISVKTIIC